MTDLYNNEEVFVVSYQNTMDIDNGFTKIVHKKSIWSKYDNLGRYCLRSLVEGKKEFQQIVPYILIRSDKFKYFILQMTSPKKDEYLNTMTLGITDHIKKEDGYKEQLFKASTRILLETVDLKLIQPFSFKGYVREMNSNTNDHLGMVLLIDNIPEDAISVKTTDFIGHWYTKKQLIEHYGKFENWSKHIINYMVDNTL